MKHRIMSLAHHRSRSSLKIRHGHTHYDDDGVQMLMSCQAGVAFVNGCLESVTNRQWGLVSSSEAAANDRAVTEDPPESSEGPVHSWA